MKIKLEVRQLLRGYDHFVFEIIGGLVVIEIFPDVSVRKS